MEPMGAARRGRNAIVRLAAGVLAAALSAVSIPAAAADGPYLGLGLGGGVLGDIDGSDGFTSTFWPGPAISGAVGYKWRWLRFEGELFYAFFILDDQTGPGGSRPPPPPSCFPCGTTGVGGDLSTLAFMANGYVDFDLGDRVRLSLGGGVGLARVAADYHFNVTVLGLPTDQEIGVVDDQDEALAYQARIGLAFAQGERAEIYLGYRFFATEDMRFDLSGGGRLRQHGIRSHIAEIGYRIYF